MDALTSMAGISGYRAVIEAANAFGASSTARSRPPADPAGQRSSSPALAWPSPPSAPRPTWAPSCAPTTPRRVADQVVSLGGEFVKVDYEEEGSGGGGYAKVMSEGFQAAQREMYASRPRTPTSSSPPR